MFLIFLSLSLSLFVSVVLLHSGFRITDLERWRMHEGVFDFGFVEVVFVLVIVFSIVFVILFVIVFVFLLSFKFPQPLLFMGIAQKLGPG